MGTIKTRIKKKFSKYLSSKGYYLTDQPMRMRMNFGNVSRVMYYKERFESISNVDGAIVECGIGSGSSLFHFAVLNQIESKGRDLYGFDSFEGFPEPSAEDSSERNVEGGVLYRGWASDPEQLKRVFRNDFRSDFNFELKLVKGFFENSITEGVIKDLKKSGIALLHLDVDLYDSYKVTLERLFPLVNSGGVILFDEYINEKIKFPGAQKAIDEYFGSDKNGIEFDEHSNRYYFIKK